MTGQAVSAMVVRALHDGLEIHLRRCAVTRQAGISRESKLCDAGIRMTRGAANRMVIDPRVDLRSCGISSVRVTTRAVCGPWASRMHARGLGCQRRFIEVVLRRTLRGIGPAVTLAAGQVEIDPYRVRVRTCRGHKRRLLAGIPLRLRGERRVGGIGAYPPDMRAAAFSIVRLGHMTFCACRRYVRQVAQRRTRSARMIDLRQAKRAALLVAVRTRFLERHGGVYRGDRALVDIVAFRAAAVCRAGHKGTEIFCRVIDLLEISGKLSVNTVQVFHARRVVVKYRRIAAVAAADLDRRKRVNGFGCRKRGIISSGRRMNIRSQTAGCITDDMILPVAFQAKCRCSRSFLDDRWGMTACRIMTPFALNALQTLSG